MQYPNRHIFFISKPHLKSRHQLESITSLVGSNERQTKVSDKFLFNVVSSLSFIGIWILIVITTYKLYSLTFYEKDNILYISQRVYSDFLSHIPLIRYFRFVQNLKFEYPLWLGEPIRYHFFFYMLVGLVERTGINIGVALNILSTVGTILFFVCIYYLGKYLLNSKFAPFLAIFLFFFNSSLVWIYPLRQSGISYNLLHTITSSNDFYAFGPWKDTIVSAFQNLNIYINQRHLTMSYAFTLIILWSLFYSKSNRAKCLGLVLCAILPLLNRAVLPILAVSIVILFIYKIKKKSTFVWSVLFVLALLPGILYLNPANTAKPSITPGYLYKTPSYSEIKFPIHSLPVQWIIYWVFNLGLLPLLALHGAWLIKKESGLRSDKLAWFLIAIALFCVVNIFQISSEMAVQHKLLNFAIVLANIFAVKSLLYWFKSKAKPIKLLGLFFVISLTLGGLVDLFPVINGAQYEINDIEKNKISSWIVKNTQPKSNFLNLTYSTLPVSITGRKIYFGWPYFNLSNGYDVNKRQDLLMDIMQEKNGDSTLLNEICKYKIEYIYTDEDTFMDIPLNRDYLNENFDISYMNPASKVLIYKTHLDKCPSQ